MTQAYAVFCGIDVGKGDHHAVGLMLLNGTCIAEVRENGRAIGDEPPGGDDDLGDDVAAMPTAGFDSAL